MSRPHQASHPQVDEDIEEQRVEAARRYVQQLQASYVHVGVHRANGARGTGDAVRLVGQGDMGLVAGDEGTEVLIWTTGG